MADDKSTKRQQTAAILIRCLPEEKARLEKRAAEAEAELRRTYPRFRLGVGPWLLSLGLGDAPAPKRKGSR